MNAMTAAQDKEQPLVAERVPVDEEALVRERRAQAGVADADAAADRIGLALSGGGVRSATFNLGLLRGLAGAGSLRQMDYLSTVSGGGYIGSAFTRLFNAKQGAAAVEEALKSDTSTLLWWLRNNGRYLTPAGLRDMIQATASITRGALSTHVEVAVLLVLFACALVLPYGTGLAWPTALRDAFISFWWAGAAASLWVVFHHVFAYWTWADDKAETPSIGDWVLAALAAALGVYGWHAASTVLFDAAPSVGQLGTIAAYALLLSPITSVFSRLRDRGLGQSAARLKHTRGLGLALAATALLVLAGALDLGTWLLAHRATGLGTALPGIAAFIVAAYRMLHGPVKRLIARLSKSGASLEPGAVAAFIGLLLLFLLVVFWTTAVQWLASPCQAREAQHACAAFPGWLAWPVWGRWMVLLAAPIVYVGLTLRIPLSLNLSSLHHFYRARLERAYVSTGNDARFPRGALVPRDQHEKAVTQMKLARAIPGDDVPLAAHEPHRFGGPIHLVNCCINQTVDDRTDTYNADRKGVALTVSSLGIETGTRLPMQGGPAVPGTLSRWASISGAAASSGMGSQTSPGLAALLFLSGLRLGYWSEGLSRQDADRRQRVIRSELVSRELFARFPGLGDPCWYLSDGGHFENTGVYALLKRKPALVIASDCGADPGYAFADVENMVRKAYIDHAAVIEFVKPPAATAVVPTHAKELRDAIGLPEDFQGSAGPECLLLARITYVNGASGTLVVVKPRVTGGLCMDTACYAAGHAPFPQQPTADQFFDEAQWEAYHRLGVHLARLLTPDNLRQMCKWAS